MQSGIYFLVFPHAPCQLMGKWIDHTGYFCTRTANVYYSNFNKFDFFSTFCCCRFFSVIVIAVWWVCDAALEAFAFQIGNFVHVHRKKNSILGSGKNQKLCKWSFFFVLFVCLFIYGIAFISSVVCVSIQRRLIYSDRMQHICSITTKWIWIAEYRKRESEKNTHKF